MRHNQNLDQRPTAAYSYRLSRCKDLPEDRTDLAANEMAPLRSVWLEQSGEIVLSGRLCNIN